MGDFLGILLLICIIALSIGIINPKWVIRWGNKRTRGRVLLVYGVMFVFIVIMCPILDPPKNTTANQNESKNTLVAYNEIKINKPQKENLANTSGLKISASLEDFKNEMPILSRSKMETREKEGYIYSWENLSAMGNPNGAILYDNDKDGILDQITVIVIFNIDDKMRTTKESLAILYKFITIAGGSDVSFDDFSSWIRNNLSKDGAKRKFGTVHVNFGYTAGKDRGGVAIVTINERMKTS